MSEQNELKAQVNDAPTAIEVMRLTTKDGRTFYNCDHCPELMQETLTRCPEWKTIEKIEMTWSEYIAIPATNEAARLWDVSAGIAAAAPKEPSP